MNYRVSLRARMLPLIVVGVLGVAAVLRWTLGDVGVANQDMLVYIAGGALLLGAAAVCHVLALRYPERYAVDGLAWTLTIVSVVTVGLLSLAIVGSFGG